jgi:hypothetical protein
MLVPAFENELDHAAAHGAGAFMEAWSPPTCRSGTPVAGRCSTPRASARQGPFPPL